MEATTTIGRHNIYLKQIGEWVFDGTGRSMRAEEYECSNSRGDLNPTIVLLKLSIVLY